MRLATVAPDLSPEPILSAFAGYRGSVIDLDQGRVFGPSALQRGFDFLRSELRRAGLAPGQRVVTAVGNGPRFLSALAAILAEGGSPLLVHVKTPPRELERYVMKFGAHWALFDGWTQPEIANSSLASAATLSDALGECRLAMVDTTQAGFTNQYPSLPGVPLHPTSGTTGLPKIAVRPGPAAVAEAEHYIESIGIETRDAILVTSPMSHAYAYGMGVMVPLLSGANILSTRNFEAAIVRQALIENRVSIFPAVPGMLDLLTFGAGDRLRDTMRCVLSAGAPLPARTARRFYDCTGAQIRPLYGTTETGGISVGPDLGRLPEDGYVGPPMRGVEAEIRDEIESDSPVKVGRLHIRSSSMMSGYLGHDGIDTSFVQDGWFLTGDLANFDAQGFLYLHGRQSEVINVGGLKVIPREVEEAIATLDGVRDLKVYAGQDRNGRQFVKAALVVTPEVDVSAVQAHCERELVYYKRPRNILLVEKLPRTPSGKIILGELP